jgi:hypothetical protein
VEPSYLAYESRDRLGSLSNEIDDVTKTYVRRRDLIRPRVRPDVQLLVKIWVVAEPYKGPALDMGSRRTDDPDGHRPGAHNRLGQNGHLATTKRPAGALPTLAATGSTSLRR